MLLSWFCDHHGNNVAVFKGLFGSAAQADYFFCDQLVQAFRTVLKWQGFHRRVIVSSTQMEKAARGRRSLRAREASANWFSSVGCPGNHCIFSERTTACAGDNAGQ